MSHIRQREYTPLSIEAKPLRPDYPYWTGIQLKDEYGEVVAEIPPCGTGECGIEDAKRLAFCWNHHDALLTACRKVLECTSNGNGCTCIENSAIDAVRRAVDEVDRAAGRRE